MHRVLQSMACVLLIVSCLPCGAADEPSASAPSSTAAPSLHDRMHEVGTSIQSGARQVGATAKKAGHQIAETSVDVAHKVRDASKAGYAKARAKIRGEPRKPDAQSAP